MRLPFLPPHHEPRYLTTLPPCSVFSRKETNRDTVTNPSFIAVALPTKQCVELTSLGLLSQTLTKSYSQHTVASWCPYCVG